MEKNSVLYIVMPAFNEAINIRRVIDQWYPIVERFGGQGSRLVIFDDGSTDETYSLMLAAQKDHPLFVPITKANSGHGATVLAAYHYAIDHRADFIFQTDSDGQTLPAEFEDFWKLRGSFDMIIGNRHARAEGIFRKVVTLTLRLMLRIIFGVSLIDPNTPFRLMNAATLKKFIDRIPDGQEHANALIAAMFVKNGLRVKYLPITFNKRTTGQSWVRLSKIA